MQSAKERGIWYGQIWGWSTFICVVVFALIFLVNGFSEASVRMNIRWSARFSGLLFAMAFGASGVHKFWQNSFSFWLLVNRKYLGISFATIHLLHLIFLVLLQINFHPVFEVRPVFDVLLGGLAYLFIVTMLLTSFESIARKIPKPSWKRLHTLGGYYILTAFTQSNLFRVLDGKLEYLPMTTILLSVWVVRLWVLRR